MPRNPLPLSTVADVSIGQAAFLKGVSDRTIRRWIAAGLLPARRIGHRTVRIRMADLEALGTDIPTAS